MVVAVAAVVEAEEAVVVVVSQGEPHVCGGNRAPRRRACVGLPALDPMASLTQPPDWDSQDTNG